jgi:hypothetical protein
MGENRKNRAAGKSAAVDLPAGARDLINLVNGPREEQGLPKYSVALIVEAMATEGMLHDWHRHLETIDQRKKQTQTGRGRPRKQV